MDESEVSASQEEIFRTPPEITDPITDDPESYWPENKVKVIQSEIERCLRKVNSDVDLKLADFDCATAKWDRKNANCKSNQRFVSSQSQREFNKRLTQIKHCEGHYIISVHEEISDFDDFIDCIRHEVAHAVLFAIHGESKGHGNEWKTVAHRIGADPSRTAHKLSREYKYYIVCPECNSRWGRHRNSKFVKRPHLLECPKCETVGLESYEVE